MLQQVVTAVRQDSPQQLLVYVDGADKAHCIHPSTLHKIQSGDLNVEDIRIGEFLNKLEEAVYRSFSSLVSVRRIPGTQYWECFVCGRTAQIDGDMFTCRRCRAGSALHVDKYRGVCVDLRQVLDANPEVSRLFLNKPWNPHPPWMGREEVEKLLEEEI
jgi:hypothetical protein